MSYLPEKSASAPLADEGKSRSVEAIPSARAVAVCGGATGSGKTTVLTNLGFALADRGQRVCLFEADTNLRDAGRQLGLSPAYNLEDYLLARAPLENTLWSVSDGVQLLSGTGQVDDLVNLTGSQRKRLIEGIHRLESVFDYLLVDCGNGRNEIQMQLMRAAPFVVLVVTGEHGSQREALALLHRLKAQGFGRPVMLVVNRTSGGTAAQACFQRLDKAARLHLGLRIYLLGYMAQDPCIDDALERHVPFIRLCPDALATHHLEVIAHRLHQVVLGTRGARGEFGAFFEALQLIDETPERPPSRRALLRQFAELATGMDHQQLVGLLREIISCWEERNGRRFELPDSLTAASAMLRDQAPPRMREGTAPTPETPRAGSGGEQIRTQEVTQPDLQLVTPKGPSPTPRSKPATGDGLRAAVSMAAKVGPL